MARRGTAPRSPRRASPALFASIGTGITQGVGAALAMVVTAALVALWTFVRPPTPGQEHVSAWETEVMQAVTFIETNAHKASWRPMPGGQLDVYVVGGQVRKLVRHERHQRAREYFFTGDTLAFVFFRDEANLRFARARQGTGHRYYFHPQPQWMEGDTVRLIAWIAPGNHRVAEGSPQFAAAERELLREAAELWEVAHDPGWQRRPPVDVLDPGDGEPAVPGDEG